MKYKVTFKNGQVSIYDTKTPLDEFKGQFTEAASVEVLDAVAPAPVVTPVAEATTVETPKKRGRKSATE